MKEKTDVETMKKLEVQQRKEQQMQKEKMNFRASYRKYRSNQRLLTTDLRTLLRRVRTADDPPIKSKLADMVEQWNALKHRLDDYDVNDINTNVRDDNEIAPPNVFVDATPAVQQSSNAIVVGPQVLVPQPHENLLGSVGGSATLILSNSENQLNSTETHSFFGI
jgi:hypothetical protein